MEKVITETKVDNRGLKSYGLKLGELVDTDFGEGKVIGLIIVESHINSFQLSNNQKLHMVQVELKDGTTVGQSIISMKDKIWEMSEKMANQIFEDYGI